MQTLDIALAECFIQQLRKDGYDYADQLEENFQLIRTAMAEDLPFLIAVDYSAVWDIDDIPGALTTYTLSRRFLDVADEYELISFAGSKAEAHELHLLMNFLCEGGTEIKPRQVVQSGWGDRYMLLNLDELGLEDRMLVTQADAVADALGQDEPEFLALVRIHANENLIPRVIVNDRSRSELH